jgi:predicted ATPase
LITEFHAKNYGPLKTVTCALTPLHAFVGPNDSGKSSFLRGIVTTLNQIAAVNPRFTTSQASDLRLIFTGGAQSVWLPGMSPQFAKNPDEATLKWMRQGAKLCRFEADALRRPSSLVTPAQRLNWIDQRGLGLPGALDILLRRNDNSFQDISRGFVSLFPTVGRLMLPNISSNETQVQTMLHDGTEIDANSMSEGMLYYLAYATLQRLGGAALIAVEEPETGLHPSRIAEVMRILRGISETGTQIVIATHSPLVINELKQDEVSIVTRSAAEGTKVKRMAETANFKERAKIYALGELWLSYANGVDESPLLDGEEGEEA